MHYVDITVCLMSFPAVGHDTPIDLTFTVSDNVMYSIKSRSYKDLKLT